MNRYYTSYFFLILLEHLYKNIKLLTAFYEKEKHCLYQTTNTKSLLLAANIGLPKGSVLRPILVLHYVSDVFFM